MPVVIITLESKYLPGAIDLELPDDVELKQLLPTLTQALGQNFKLPPGRYQLAHDSHPLPPQLTLADGDVLTGHKLSLLAVQVSSSQTDPAALAQYPRIATLTTPSGRTIALDNIDKNQLLIGRYTSRMLQPPDIDLGDEPKGDTVSRVHAQLQRKQGKWFITPRASSNPTRIAGKELVYHQEHPLSSGDKISLGAVHLKFKQEQ